MRTITWHEGKVRMIDQRQLPWELVFVEFADYRAVAEAITNMTVRGAPAIGAAAGFGLALAARQIEASDLNTFRRELQTAADHLKLARPTAVNLAWAVDRLMNLANGLKFDDVDSLREALLNEAQLIADEDVAINQRMGTFGAALIQDGDTILHHCNTGALATVDYGTALGVIRTAFEQGKRFHTLLDETRPRLQGARLSAWELKQLGASFDIIPDTAAGFYMQKGEIKIVLVGADRIAANGDVANKIGTYQIAVLAHENGIPFYSVAPISTVDLNLATGALIPIEERSGDEVRAPFGKAIVPDDYPARNPAFDVTPARYLSGIITENGIVLPPFEENLPKAVRGKL
ncbi:MAG: S-methyl-5-thioribose-1-phosphate isomerase [Anaerolineae bacterium]|nr:S-methyl-5-thioribose-1-phosphate isomerase [Anaerolineae bacterium]